LSIVPVNEIGGFRVLPLIPLKQLFEEQVATWGARYP
jgi:hypothetical protein